MFATDIEKEIFDKYKWALFAIGVDFSDERIIDCITDCTRDLETRFQAIISYWIWLKKEEREIIDPNQLLIAAFWNEWKPITWKDEFLKDPELRSPAQKWWDNASQVDIIKELVVDIKSNLFTKGTIYFRVPYDDPWAMNLDRAEQLTWDEIIEEYEKGTGVNIKTMPRKLILEKEDSLNRKKQEALKNCFT